MKQISSILQLRFSQLSRIAMSSGWRGIIALPALLATVVYCIISLTGKGALYLNSVVACIVALIELSRKDKTFLQLLQKNGLQLRWLEYSILIALCNIYPAITDPGTIPYLLTNILFAAALVFIPRKGTGINMPVRSGKLTGLLPLQVYELKYAVRQLIWLLLIVWVISVVASFFGPVIPFFILLGSLILLEHISYAEPTEITQSYLLVSRALDKKAIKLCLIMFLFFLPQMFISLYMWYSLPLLFAIVTAYWTGLASMFFAFLLKYDNTPGATASLSKNIQLALFIIVTPLIPVAIYLLHKQYKSARCNLQPLLN